MQAHAFELIFQNRDAFRAWLLVNAETSDGR